jgi:hypothetical protein
LHNGFLQQKVVHWQHTGEVEVPPFVSGLWPIRRASINIESIIFSSEVSGGLHMRGMMSSIIPPMSLIMCGDAGAPSKK